MRLCTCACVFGCLHFAACSRYRRGGEVHGLRSGNTITKRGFGNSAVAADGDGLIVYFDYDRQRSCEIPEAIVSAIEALEGRAAIL